MSIQSYSPAFETAVRTVLDHEGGFVDDPDDPGGATNWGISLRWLNELGHLDRDGDGFHDFDFDLDGRVGASDIRLLPRETAIALYHEHWWVRFGYAELPEMIGAKTFDLAVNMGARQAHRLLQRALRAAGMDIEDDGWLGPRTRAAIDLAARDPGSRAVRAALRSEAAGFYRGLIVRKPVFAKYRTGWLRRAYA